MATRLRAQRLPPTVRVEGARLRCAPPKRLTREYERSEDECGVQSAKSPGLSLGGLQPPCSRPGFRVPIGTHFPSSFAWLAAQNSKCLVLQGLTDFGPVAERSVLLRFFPELSVSFRFVPEFSVSFRSVAPGAWCRAGSAECGGHPRNPISPLPSRGLSGVAAPSP